VRIQPLPHARLHAPTPRSQRGVFILIRSTGTGHMPTESSTAIITNDIVGLGLIAATLA
jgi:hypothetical protein